MTRSMSPTPWGALLLTAALFGSSFLFIKVSVAGIPPFTFATGRAILAAVAVVAFLHLSGGRLPKPGKVWLPMIVLALLTAVIPYVAIAFGQLHIDSSLGGILFATIPVFSVLLAPLVLAEEHLTPTRVFGVLIGFAGVILAIGPGAFSTLGTQVLGAGVTVFAALSYAIGTLFARTLSSTSPVVLAAGQLVVASFALIPLSLLIDTPWSLSPEPAHLVGLVVVALFNTAIPVLLMFWLIGKAGASNTSLLAFFMPVASVLLGVLVLGESLGWFAILGFGFIISGAGLVTGTFRIPRRTDARHV